VAVTVSCAAALVMLPAPFETVTVKVAPSSAAVAGGVE
jgi:hypothetical protein